MKSGILAVDKPSGMTSHTIITLLRRFTGVRRIGHAGTLDPLATGVLPVCIGRATRAADYVADAPKQYVATLKLGVETDSEDSEGTVLRECEPTVGARELSALLPRFTGEIDQIPPMYSAIQRNGERLYKLAREGVTVEREPRRITIYGLELLEADEDAHTYVLRVDCSKGTYIRTLCADLGRALGCGGIMTALRRTRCGGFSAEEAYTIDELRAASEEGRLETLIRDTELAFADWPALEIDPEGAHRLKNGAPVYRQSFLGTPPEGIFRIRSEGEFLGFGRIEKGLLLCDKSFFETEAKDSDA